MQGMGGERRVAQVAVDMPLAHLDRRFDYLVPEALDEQAVVGARVRVRFAGRLRDGYILARTTVADPDRTLAPLERVISAEVVLTPAIAELVRSVADHYAGTFADVVRLAVPPRHGLTENATPPVHPEPTLGAPAAILPHYAEGERLLAAVASGTGRAALTLAPVNDRLGDWPGALIELAGAALAGGRGALLLVPDHRDLELLAERCTAAFGRGSFVTLSAESGPAARYRAFLAAARGDVRLVLGTRAAAFTPIADLGVIALFDDGDDSWVEPRSPGPHSREVVALRAAQERCGLVYVGYGRTAEVEALVRRGWLASVGVPVAVRRERCPVVRVAAGAPSSRERDPGAHSRLPREVFETIRAALARGPVLLQVPRAGYLAGLACANCREPARCPTCSQPLSAGRTEQGRALPRCRWCGPVARWVCGACGSDRLRAPRIGVERTAEELGRAFPQTRVIVSNGDKPVREVGEEPALVVATPGTEPLAIAGYAAAVLLDGDALLARADLRAAEEALRRWLAATALVSPAAEGGTVMIVAEPTARAVQALVRLDAEGFAERELAERVATGFPPGAKLVTLEGSAAVVGEAGAALRGLRADALGPVPLPAPAEGVRLALRCPISEGKALVAGVKELLASRSAHKADGTLRVRVDPQVL